MVRISSIMRFSRPEFTRTNLVFELIEAAHVRRANLQRLMAFRETRQHAIEHAVSSRSSGTETHKRLPGSAGLPKGVHIYDIHDGHNDGE